jgi:phosphoesterase RecJ-like protein
MRRTLRCDSGKAGIPSSQKFHGSCVLTEQGFKNLYDYLAKFSKIVITTHESPDPDGIGAEMAFAEFLIAKGKTVRIFNADETPEKYQFLDIENKIELLGENTEIPADIDSYGLIILDTNDYKNTGTVNRLMESHITDIFIIDHHSRQASDESSHMIDGTASSTCEMVYYVFEREGMKPSLPAAQCIFAGIVFDTGSFKYPKTSPSTFRAAAALVETGVRPIQVNEILYETYSVSSLVLKSKMLASMEMHYGGKVVLMYLTPEMLLETGGIFSEGEININMPLTVQDVVISALIKQNIGGPVKVSMRTKGDLNVADIAMAHNGGGHKNAAGYKSYTSLRETRTQVLEDVKIFFPGETAE